MPRLGRGTPPRAPALTAHPARQTLQNSTTAQLIFNVPQVVSYCSKVFTLLPGDLIFTGTPPGVGFARKPPRWLKHVRLCTSRCGRVVC